MTSLEPKLQNQLKHCTLTFLNYSIYLYYTAPASLFNFVSVLNVKRGPDGEDIQETEDKEEWEEEWPFNMLD